MLLKNILNKYINKCIIYINKNQKFVEFLKIKTPLYQIVSRIIFRKEIVEAKKVYFLLKKINFDHPTNFTEKLILNYQKNKLISILEHAYNFSLYYRRLFDQNKINFKNLNDFYNIPLLDKTIIRERKREIICKNIYENRFYIFNTGGSTGEPLEFPVSYMNGFVDKFHQKYTFEIMGYSRNDKIYAFGGSSIPAHLRNQNIYWIEKSREDVPYGRLLYSSLYLDENTIKYYVRHLLTSRPSILRGYPSFINEIAEYLLKNKIKITFNIKGVQLTSENIFDWQVKNIKEAFNTDVFFQYGQAEACVYAFTKSESYKYYCSPFYGIVEVLDANNKPVKKGEVGEIVATSFYNKALPFIRYKTGDLAVYNGNNNGIIELERIEGRTQDFIYKKNGEKISITGLIFGQHYHAFKNIKKWQILQRERGKIIINIIKDKNFGLHDEKEIMEKFKINGNLNVKINYVKKIKLTKRGKFRFVIVDI